jgi:methylmalonyl-CoA mutase, N-terminal domain
MIAGGGGGGLTKEQPENNIVRSAYYALISALSGTQTMALCSYDEAYTIPTEHSAEISLRTMQIMIHEMGICDTVDPLGGSYYVESLTDTFEKKIKEEMKTVDKWGGIVNAVATGKIQESVSKQAYEREMGMQTGKVDKVGVNIFTKDEEKKEVEFHPYNQEAADNQVDKLKRIKASRDNEKVATLLAAIKSDAENDKNLMPSIIAAVKEYATVGEIVQAMKDVYGEFEEPIFF